VEWLADHCLIDDETASHYHARPPGHRTALNLVSGPRQAETGKPTPARRHAHLPRSCW
jgi:hypothetical protein